MLCAGKKEDLQKNLQIWKEELSKRNMKINTEKTKIMDWKRSKNIPQLKQGIYRKKRSSHNNKNDNI
ncbi:hypothetical protein RN001_016081 [Aquatica leii]|uniref:Uncharacterized protein n=1 Tax=Aquatica leii TaxID=1421715 RepID=A0AAN7PNS6_9COLE|nr:hypothetical protein RN001_016081 [Aquatica leii]